MAAVHIHTATAAHRVILYTWRTQLKSCRVSTKILDASMSADFSGQTDRETDSRQGRRPTYTTTHRVRDGDAGFPSDRVLASITRARSDCR